MIEVVLADDEHLIRTALATLLGLEADLTVVAEVGSGEDLLTVWRQRIDRDLPPPVAVLDLEMPGLDGIDTAAEILRLTPSAATMIVTSHGRPGYLKRALALGVRGFLPKTASAATLASVIRSIEAGGRYVDPELAAEAIHAGDSPLTAREADVLEYAADGASVNEIARRAHLSPGTTRNYLSAAVAKLAVANRHEAVARARERGWI